MRSSLILAVISALIAVVGQLLLKQVMQDLGPVSDLGTSSLTAMIKGLFTQPLMYVAGVVYVLGFTSWLVVLSRIQLSAAYPILALSYILIPIASIIFFNEQINAVRWIGIATIAIGIIVVGLSYRQ